MKTSIWLVVPVLICVTGTVIYAMNKDYDSITLDNPIWGELEFEKKKASE